MMQIKKFLLLTLAVFLSCSNQSDQKTSVNDLLQWEKASKNYELVNEGYSRCRNFVHGWLNYADSASGLIPRNLQSNKDIWNAKDAAADNYPFMVLTAAITDSVLLHGTMMQMLESEQNLTSRVGHLPDTYNFLKAGYDQDKVLMQDIIFGSSEYIKDGLLPLTEWLGESPWSDRMIDILDDIWVYAEIETPFGRIPSDNIEVNGEMLQVLSRIFYMTGDERYLEWATRLGDYYLLGDHHPTRNFSSLRLRDHGCEIVSGLCELYAVVSFEDSGKKITYQPHISEMLDKILEVGRNEHGLFYDVVNPQTGEIVNDRVADNFGYNLNGFYTVYQLDSVEAYRQAVIKSLKSLNMYYRDFDWENGSADGYADAIEGALNLYNRERISDVEKWLDSEIKVMWSKQQDDGIIEGWHGDGNFARTTIMYCLWKSKGLTLKPWRADVTIAAEMDGDTLWIAIKSDAPWEGRLIFDQPRHHSILNLPFDWPRINQFPEWFTIQSDTEYQVQKREGEKLQKLTSGNLLGGLPLEIGKGAYYYRVSTIDPGAY